MPPSKNSQNNSSLIHIQHAHDRLFRESMQDIEICREFILLTFPSSVMHHIDWETLEIVKDDWIDQRLKEHRSDVLYRFKLLKNDQWVYLLFEHKSTPDKKIHKKLFRYIIEIWALHEKQQDETFNRLPVVIPIIVYNGNTPVISPIV